jgi:hypothetical protein
VQKLCDQLPPGERRTTLGKMPIRVGSGMAKNRAHFMSGDEVVFVVNLKTGTAELCSND